MSPHFSTVPFKTSSRSQVMQISLEISMLIFLPKLEPPCLPRCSRVLFLSPAIAKTLYNQYHKSRYHISIFPSHLNCSAPTVSPLELVLSRSVCFELSAFAAKIKAFYNCCKVSCKEHCSCSACGHLLQDLNHLCLDCLASMQNYLRLCSLHAGV